MSKRQQYLFVYGTLMKGLSNHRYLDEEEFIDKGEISGFGLYNVTIEYPGIVRREDSKVMGELYKVDEDLFKVLDEFEGEEYNRIEVDVAIKGNKIKAFMYLWIEDFNEKDYIAYNKQPWKKF